MLLEHYKKVAFNKGPAMKLKLGFLVTNFVYDFSDSQKVTECMHDYFMKSIKAAVTE